MDAEIAQRLIDLNSQFYQSQAESFSATRGRLQPGVLRVLESLHGEVNILDLGCGNGSLAAELEARDYQGRYVGVDFSEELLQFAGLKVASSRSEVRGPVSDVQSQLSEVRRSGGLDLNFVKADLSTSNWPDRLPMTSYEIVFAFAVMHHIPGTAQRVRLLEQVRGMLAPGGQFIHSNWQFLNSARLRKRIQPWAAAGLSEAEVDEGDYLLDWRWDGGGLRYVHVFSEEELAALAEKSGFAVKEAFYSDGEGGRLGLYQVWTPAAG
jgi:SAM-dependent methyltransferase